MMATSAKSPSSPKSPIARRSLGVPKIPQFQAADAPLVIVTPDAPKARRTDSRRDPKIPAVAGVAKHPRQVYLTPKTPQSAGAGNPSAPKQLTPDRLFVRGPKRPQYMGLVDVDVRNPKQPLHADATAPHGFKLPKAS